MSVRPLALLILLTGVSAAEPRPRLACALDADAGDDDLSKKSRFLREKGERDERRAERPPDLEASRVITLRNLWTHEVLPLQPGDDGAAQFDGLVRCHHTNQVTPMDRRLVTVLLQAAARFGSSTVDIVSGFRAPKYQLMLRKKGHEVARDSEHPRGHAIDFRVPSVPTRMLLKFVRSLRLGGVGYYPESQFVHADVGRVRYWRGH
jgi:hypothetical protein